MNLCTFGIHDWTVISHIGDVEKKVNEYLISDKGFDFIAVECGPARWIKYITHPDQPIFREKITIRAYAFRGANTIESCVVGSYSKVCNRCGKFKQSYTMDEVYKRVDTVINEITTEAMRILHARYIDSLHRKP